MGWRDLQEPSSGLTEAEKKAQKKNATPPAPTASAPKPKPKEDETVKRTLPDDVKAKGGVIKKMAKGGVTRGDGCAQRGKTRGRNV